MTIGWPAGLRVACADREALEVRGDHLVEGQAALGRQLRRVADLGVDDAVGGEVLGALGRDADDRVALLHDPDRVGERLEVELEGLAVGAAPDVRRELVGIGRRQPVVAELGREVDDGGRPKATVEVVVEHRLGRLADRLRAQHGGGMVQGCAERGRVRPLTCRGGPVSIHGAGCDPARGGLRMNIVTPPGRPDPPDAPWSSGAAAHRLAVDGRWPQRPSAPPARRRTATVRGSRLRPNADVHRCDLSDATIIGHDLHGIDFLVGPVRRERRLRSRSAADEPGRCPHRPGDPGRREAVRRDPDRRGPARVGHVRRGARGRVAEPGEPVVDELEWVTGGLRAVRGRQPLERHAGATGSRTGRRSMAQTCIGSTSAARICDRRASSASDLRYARLDGVDLTDADLTGANWRQATGLASATFSNTTCPDGTNSDANGGTCVGH